jgi:hemerythrin-like domain-containing protein
MIIWKFQGKLEGIKLIRRNFRNSIINKAESFLQRISKHCKREEKV